MSEEEVREPCPTPLSWQDVVETFRAESERWQFDEHRLHGAIWGDGPPLYFLNGITGNHELFALSAYLLRDQFRCVLLDYSGSDRDRLSESPRSYRSISRDLLAIADTLHDDSFCIYAAPFGTPAAIQTMIDHPSRIEQAILQTPFAAPRQLSFTERMLLKVTRKARFPVRRIPGFARLQALNHASWFPPYDFTRWQFFLENTGHTPIGGLARRAKLLTDCEFGQQLGEIQTPVLLLRTEGEGRQAAELADDVGRQLGNAATESLHTTGHNVFLTHPHRLVKLARAFFTGESVPSEADSRPTDNARLGHAIADCEPIKDC